MRTNDKRRNLEILRRTINARPAVYVLSGAWSLRDYMKEVILL